MRVGCTPVTLQTANADVFCKLLPTSSAQMGKNLAQTKEFDPIMWVTTVAFFVAKPAWKAGFKSSMLNLEWFFYFYWHPLS